MVFGHMNWNHLLIPYAFPLSNLKSPSIDPIQIVFGSIKIFLIRNYLIWRILGGGAGKMNFISDILLGIFSTISENLMSVKLLYTWWFVAAPSAVPTNWREGEFIRYFPKIRHTSLQGFLKTNKPVIKIFWIWNFLNE